MKSKSQTIIAGQLHRVPYPFCWEKFTAYPVKYGPGVETDTWRPGTQMVDGGEYGRYGEQELSAVSHGMGFMLAEVISIHKPGRFPERVFFTRTWETPDGKQFGKQKLRITTTAAFRRLIKGYRYEFELVEEDGPSEPAPSTVAPKLDIADLPF